MEDFFEMGGESMNGIKDKSKERDGDEESPANAILGRNDTKSAESRASVVETWKGEVDLNRVLVDIAQVFEESDEEGVRVLVELLRDPVSLEARCGVVEGLSKSEAGELLSPAGLICDQNLMREIAWIASGSLLEAFRAGLGEPRRFARLLAHPVTMRLAQRALLDGIEAIDRELELQQLRTWEWLREEVVGGRLTVVRGESVVGKHVAAFAPHQEQDDLVVADSARAARTAAAKKWLIPDKLVAVTFVDPS